MPATGPASCEVCRSSCPREENRYRSPVYIALDVIGYPNALWRIEHQVFTALSAYRPKTRQNASSEADVAISFVQQPTPTLTLRFTWLP